MACRQNAPSCDPLTPEPYCFAWCIWETNERFFWKWNCTSKSKFSKTSNLFWIKIPASWSKLSEKLKIGIKISVVQASSWVIGQNMQYCCYFWQHCWWFWDSAQHLLNFGLRCSSILLSSNTAILSISVINIIIIAFFVANWHAIIRGLITAWNQANLAGVRMS